MITPGRYHPVPLVFHHGETDPHAKDAKLMVLLECWRRIETAGHVGTVWYDGSIRTVEQFLRTFIECDDLYPLVVWDTQEQDLAMLAWVSALNSRHAVCHFVSLRPYRRGVAECAIDFWEQKRDHNGDRLLVLLMGVTPETNVKALKMSRHVGFVRVGTMPRLCWIENEHRFVGGVIHYRELGEENGN